VTTPEEHIRKWLTAVQSGCSFASILAGRSKGLVITRLDEVDGATAQILESVADGAATESKVLLAIFPHLRGEAEVVSLLEMLAQRPRWKIGLLPWKRHKRDDAQLVSLSFTTACDHQFAVMGFAPFGSMPVTRRAPYVGLAIWGGGHANEHHSADGQSVGLPDVPTRLTADKHALNWQQTTAKTKALLSSPPEDRAQLREMAFCLTKSVLPASVTQPSECA